MSQPFGVILLSQSSLETPQDEGGCTLSLYRMTR